MRGEWVDLEPLAKPVLPGARREWSESARRLWRAWRKSPESAQWSAVDVAYAIELAARFEKLPPHEQRLRMDSLGLTPKGKRDLRWRLPQAKAAEQKTTTTPTILSPLRAV